MNTTPLGCGPGCMASPPMLRDVAPTPALPMWGQILLGLGFVLVVVTILAATGRSHR